MMKNLLFTPHGYCLAWDPALIWLHAGSDLLIAMSYYSIPAVLVVIARHRQDLVFRPVLYLFAAFIMACGTTHLLGMISLWVPLYWTEGVVLGITAVLSMITATLLWPLLPRFLALPSTSQLQALNARLAEQIRERDEAAAHLRASEERLRQVQKLAAIGQLTGGIAHDFNNMLQAISSGVEMMHRRIGQGRYEQALSFVDPTRQSIHRAGNLVQGLLAFARRQPLAPKQVQLAELVPAIAALITQTIGPAIDLELKLNQDAWPVHCDPNQLESALVNLAINARDAMLPGGGRLTIETENMVLTQAEIAGWEGARPGRFVRTSLTDTGTGMAPDVLEHAFEPFFTTKIAGQGTGLGLSQVFGFVTQSKGIVHLQSEVGHGTSVHLFLPAFEGSGTTEPSAGSPAKRDVQVCASVLLVDDETNIRWLAAEALRDAGCHVVEVGDAAGALAILRDRLPGSGARIDMMVTDVGLPGGFNGRQLANAAREIIPGLPVLLITGYAGDAVESHGGLVSGMALLRKPFDLDRLVHEVLEMTR